MSKDWLEQLADITKTPTSQLKFINEAWNQVCGGWAGRLWRAVGH